MTDAVEYLEKTSLSEFQGRYVEKLDRLISSILENPLPIKPTTFHYFERFSLTQ